MTDNKELTSPLYILKDLVAGTVAGWVQVIIGQPFDTVKVRLQTSQPGALVQYEGALDCVKKTFYNEGIFGFYKGTLAPLIGIGACVSVQFAAITQAKTFLLSFKEPDPQNSNYLSIPEVAICGAIAGLANAPLSGPIEMLRIRAQTQTKSSQNPYLMLKEMAKKQGSLLVVYKSWDSTLLREIPGLACYFAFYEAAIRFMTPKGKTVNDIPSWGLLACGGFSGIFMWLFCYPLDVVKSKMQNDSFEKPLYKSTWNCYSKVWKTEGIRGFYRGLLPCLIRALPVNAATFVAYELAMRGMGGRKI